ncbi:MAG: DNA mismatch repair protein MutS [Sphaerochaetaceae bacterium]
MNEEEKITPMMVQYRSIKEKNKDKVLFFRLGDFYEMFDDDAVEVSRLLNLTLTHRAARPMCGIPYHAAKSYIRRLLDLGKKIAICEQLELNADSRQLARREVIQVVTPATVVDDDFLDARNPCYVLCISYGKALSVSYADITSGEFVMSTVPQDRGFVSLLALLEQVGPREILVGEDDYFLHQDFQGVVDGRGAMVTKLPDWEFRQKDAFKKLCKQVGTTNLKGFGFEEDDPALASGGALLSYLEDTAKASLAQITGYGTVLREKYLCIDEASRRNLELLSNQQDGSSRFTLFSTIDQTMTSGGARTLKNWISFPLVEKEEILARQRWVEFYYDHPDSLSSVRAILREALDLERLSTRIAMHRSYPQDLVGIQKTVGCFVNLLSLDSSMYQKLLSPALTKQRLDALLDVMGDIAKGINEQTQGPFAEGEVINDGFDTELDRLRNVKGNGKGLLDSYLEKVKRETGITTIKLSSNKIIGHYMEVSKGQTDRVPSSFYRKQTLVNAERYTTDELIALETDILRSGFAAEAREREVYESLLSQCAAQSASLKEIASFLSRVDVLSSLALTARKKDYHKPVLVDEDTLSIKAGRHPVVEDQMETGTFVPNDLDISADKNRFCLITGPNMAGKSTYLRQNALIVLLAQIGSFVPAAEVVMKPVDRLYCRVGASDNLAKGESTFLVEMQEASLILRTATERSFVIVDELGRGTSTQDGMAIAYAVMNELIAMRCKTLFATHYHELAEMDVQGIQRLTLKVSEEGSTVIFLRKVIEGVAESSYGLNVAKLAGVPYPVLREARSFQRRHDVEYAIASSQPSLFSSEPALTDTQKASVRLLDQMYDLLDHFDVDTSTPLEAMALIQKLKNLKRPNGEQ